jgi:hypothetical protein
VLVGRWTYLLIVVVRIVAVLGGGDVGTRFFVDERSGSLRGIRFTDELLQMAAQPQARAPLQAEAESRWRLVESAWHERRSTGTTLQVVYDRPSEMIVRGMLGHRRSITWVGPSLSGYQSGSCFYCETPITPLLGLPHSRRRRPLLPAHVDGPRLVRRPRLRLEPGFSVPRLQPG